MKRFRSVRCLQKFSAVHSSVFSHFNQSARYTAETISNSTAPLLSPRGAVSVRHKGQRDCPFGDWFEFV